MNKLGVDQQERNFDRLGGARGLICRIEGAELEEDVLHVRAYDRSHNEGVSIELLLHPVLHGG